MADGRLLLQWVRRRITPVMQACSISPAPRTRLQWVRRRITPVMPRRDAPRLLCRSASMGPASDNAGYVPGGKGNGAIPIALQWVRRRITPVMLMEAKRLSEDTALQWVRR